MCDHVWWRVAQGTGGGKPLGHRCSFGGGGGYKWVDTATEWIDGLLLQRVRFDRNLFNCIGDT